MAERRPTEIDALAAPRGDGDVLVTPAMSAYAAIVRANRQARQAVLRLMPSRESAQNEDSGVADDRWEIATGHQPAFIHPGVWAKAVVAAVAAQRLGGRSCFFVVDSDVVHQPELLWPVEGEDGLGVAGASVVPGEPGLTYEQSPNMSTERWRSLIAELPPRAALLSEHAMPLFRRGFLASNDTSAEPPVDARGLTQPPRRGRARDDASGDRAGDGGGCDYVERWMRGVAAVCEALEIASPRFLRVSTLFTFLPRRGPRAAATSSLDNGPNAAAWFVGQLLNDARRFATDYNEALAAYRRRRRLGGNRHPIPDLVVQDRRVEAPLWALRGRAPRRRLFVSETVGGSLLLLAGQEPIGRVDCPAILAEPEQAIASCLNGWQLRPRALALTMYLRLFECDLFIHGIGGAKYDQITDDIIRRFFQVEPPRYACVSATLRLATLRSAATRPDLMRCRRRLRDARFNPQRYIGVSSPEQAPLQAELDQRERAIAESRRLASSAPSDRTARRAAFARIRQANEAILQAVPDVSRRLTQELAEAQRLWKQNKTADSRDWFFALHPIERLRVLARALVGA